MWFRLLALALLLLPASALADLKDKVAALAPSAVVLVVDARALVDALKRHPHSGRIIAR
jgi:D-alanyl-D-alanine carboxypeptidase/D-alanyl-D-alanine-endopeptidase (penicillin-binding protein 4)